MLQGVRSLTMMSSSFLSATDDRRGHMRTSRFATLVAVGVIALPLLACNASAVAASPWSTVPLGKQMAELKGSDTVTGDGFGSSVAVSGPTVIAGVRRRRPRRTGVRVHDDRLRLEAGGRATGLRHGGRGRVRFSVAIPPISPSWAQGVTTTHAGRALRVCEDAGGLEKQVAEPRGSETTAGDCTSVVVAISG